MAFAKKSLGLKNWQVSARAKKALGQHFLKSERALKDIVSAGEIKKGETVLEIGPGQGALTEKLLEAGARVVAVEKDRALMPVLEEKFAKEIKSGKLELIEDDILKFEISKSWKQKAGSWKLIANIPYNITGAIFKKFLSGENQPEKIVVLIQKEVAERIIARDKKESVLSLSVKAYGNPKIISHVPRGAFVPAPNVDSAILEIDNINRNNFKNKKEEDLFFRIIHAGFKSKRKKLIRNLESEIKPEILKKVFEKLSLSENARAEDLPLQTWLALARERI